ncbi:MAG: hypothetical protein WDA75_21105, partial [Candidatus Latescibacterota bacterium]
MPRPVRFILAAAVLAVLGVRTLGATPVTFAFTGEVKGNGFGPSITLDSPFSGTVTFDSDPAIQLHANENGHYAYSVLAPSGMTMTVQVGDYVFQTDPTLDPAPYTWLSQVSVLDGALSFDLPGRPDEYMVRSRVSQVGGPPLNAGPGNAVIGLSGSDPSAIVGTGLPLTPPDLARFTASAPGAFGL